MSSTRLVIIGAGGLGREVLAWATAAQRFGNAPWQSYGFVDDNEHALRGFEPGVPMIGNLTSYRPSASDLHVVAMGRPELRKRLQLQIQQSGGVFTNILHPSCIVGPRVQFGVGNLFAPFTSISVDCKLGDGILVNVHASVQHDVTIGSWAQISSHVDVGGGARIGEAAFLGSHCTIRPGAKVGELGIVAPQEVVERAC